MKKIKVVKESLPERCDVCHQKDEFNPANGVCNRCFLVNKKVVTANYELGYQVLVWGILALVFLLIAENLPEVFFIFCWLARLSLIFGLLAEWYKYWPKTKKG